MKLCSVLCIAELERPERLHHRGNRAEHNTENTMGKRERASSGPALGHLKRFAIALEFFQPDKRLHWTYARDFPTSQ